MLARLISARNRERSDLQINKEQFDNVEKDEEYTDETALNLNKDYRVNINIQNLVE